MKISRSLLIGVSLLTVGSEGTPSSKRNEPFDTLPTSRSTLTEDLLKTYKDVKNPIDATNEEFQKTIKMLKD